MSRTDSHRPGWVQQFDSTMPSYIEHDHRQGECIEETLEYARYYASHGYRNRHRCPRTTWEEKFCPDLKCTIYTEVVDWGERPFTYRPAPCRGHKVYSTDKGISCVACDNEPVQPTCTRSWGRRYTWQVSAVYGDSIPKDSLDAEWNNPERRRVRDDLGEAMKLWNAGDDLEDFDFPNNHHRHGASWHYW